MEIQAYTDANGQYRVMMNKDVVLKMSKDPETAEIINNVTWQQAYPPEPEDAAEMRKRLNDNRVCTNFSDLTTANDFYNDMRGRKTAVMRNWLN